MDLANVSSGLGALEIAKAQMSAADSTKAYGMNAVTRAKAKSTSENFEAVFLNQMFSQMFSGVKGDGPMGGNGASGVWRSFLTDEYAKSFAKAGGIGIGKQLYTELMKQQEVSR